MMGDGDTLTTRMETGILGDVKAQMNPTMARIRDVLDSLKETLSGVNGMLNMENKAYLKETLSNLSQASNALNGLLDNKNGALAKTLNNAQAMTESLKNNSADISTTIGNAKK